jgi:D-alanyl-D-alanine carboxypeptidase
MNQPLRFSSAASLIVLGSMIAGCAAHQARMGEITHFGGKADVDTGLAVRALGALNSNNVPLAISLAERAVAKTPNDAGFRALLGNAYFAGGRFLSAEQAYRDALTLYPSQPQVVLKLTLVEIAQGKNDRALALLRDSHDVLNASDYGLALALAGHPAQAIAVLEPAARDKDADATVRQNLALAHALAGDWNEARTIAAQDVPGNQLDGRIHQWMQLASPKHPSDQVAALVGVTPAVLDAGQPVQLALNKDDNTRLAQAPKAVPVKKAPELKIAAAQAAVVPAPAAPAKPAFVQAVAPIATPRPVIAVAPAPPPPRSTIAAFAATAVTEAKSVLAAVMPHHQAPAPKRAVRVAAARPAAHTGKFPAVVQLGAYGSPERVLAAWNGAAHKYGALKAYLPMSARFASPKGTFYRLSVRGFDSLGQASALCNSLHREGGKCFVRNVAGDAPVNIASR